MSNPPAKIPTSILDLDALFNNPLFAGGIGLASLGAAAAFARTAAIRSSGLIKRRLLVDVEISKTDPSYNWILAWLTLPRPAPNRFTAAITRVHHLSLTAKLGGRNRGSYGGFMAQPGYGRHVIRHGNAFIAVNREKGRTANMATGEPHETITMTTLYAQRHIFEEVFHEAHILAMHAQEGKTPMYTARTADWAPFGEPRRKRPLHSVVLDEGIKERIVSDVKDFLSRQEWYVDRGVPYRRGYLLYGPPGSGKSSFIQALAGELDFGVAIINLSERGMTDDRLSHLLTKLPKSTILLLEDCDAAFSNRRQVESDGYSGATVTFSGLLNALDGVAAAEERLVILTTNHVDRLDEALIRPGRIDMTVRIGEATRYQAGLMWDRFYNDIDVDGKGRERFLERLAQLGLVADADGEKKQVGLHTSAAAIQGLFLFNKDDMNGAIEMAEGLIPRIYEAEPKASRVAIKSPA